MPINLSVSATMVIKDTVVKQGVVVENDALQKLHEQAMKENPNAVRVDKQSGSLAYGQLKTSAYRQDMLTGQE